MTAPIPPPNSVYDTPSVVQAGVEGLVNNAQRLGISWGLHLGTVDSFSEGGLVAFVVLDGDSAPVGAKSMIGSLTNSQRVYVMRVPPGGYFVTGIVGPAAETVTTTPTPYYVASTSDSAAVNTSLTSVLAGGSFTFQDGRVYQVTVGGAMTPSALDNRGALTVRYNGTASIVSDFGWYGPKTSSGAGCAVYATTYVRRAIGAGNLTVSSINVVIAASSGTVVFNGISTQPRWLQVVDYASASLYPGVMAIT